MARLTERQEQICFIKYLEILKKQGKIITYFAVPNGGGRNVREAVNLKKEGVRAGVSDLCIILASNVVFIEMKKEPKLLKNNKLSYAGIVTSEKQKEFLGDINKSDVCYGAVCYGFNGAKEFIDKILKR